MSVNITMFNKFFLFTMLPAFNDGQDTHLSPAFIVFPCLILEVLSSCPL